MPRASATSGNHPEPAHAPKWLISQDASSQSSRHAASAVPHCAAVEPVADQRMPDRGQMDADLMRAPRSQVDGDQRAARRGASGVTSVIARLPPSPAPNEIGPMRLSGASIVCRFRELAFADRDVAFADALLLELARQIRVDRRPASRKTSRRSCRGRAAASGRAAARTPAVRPAPAPAS